MSEENTVVVEQQTEQVQPTLEDKAREQGWRPKEEFNGDPTKWVSAETFVAKGELIERIESLGKKLKDSEKTIKMLTEHHQKVKESEFNRAVQYLKAQKKAAYEAGDVDKIIELDDKLAEVKQTQRQETTATPTTTEVHPSFARWQNENQWYVSDSEMREDADAFGNAYAANNPDKSPEDVLEYVTKKIKRVYKDRFENPNRSKPSSVETSGSRPEKNMDGYSLSEDEKRVMNAFVRQGIMTKEDYIKDLKLAKGI